MKDILLRPKENKPIISIPSNTFISKFCLRQESILGFCLFFFENMIG